MWARYGDPDRSDTTVGIRLQFNSSEDLRQSHQQSSRAAGGDTDSESPLQVAPLRRLHYRHPRPANPDESVSAILDRASVLLGQQPHTFSFMDSSEEEPAGPTPTGRPDRDFYRIRAAVCHGHMQAGASASKWLPPQHPPSPPSPPPPPPPQQQQQHTGWTTPYDGRSAASTRTRYFFESTFLSSLPVAAAKEASESSPTESCAPLRPPPAADSATVGTAEQPLCAVFRCTGPDRPLRPPAIVQRRTPYAGPDRRESRTAACQTDTVDVQPTGSVPTQTDDTGNTALDFGSPEPLPLAPPAQKPPEPREELPPRASTGLRCRSANHLGSRHVDRHLPEQRPRLHLRIGDELTSEDEPDEQSNEQPDEQLQRQVQQQHGRLRQQELELLERRSQRQQLRESGSMDDEAAEEAGVFRIVGRRLNAFFCPGRGCCSASSAKTPAALAAATAPATAKTSASSSSAARISEESANNWQQVEPWSPSGPGGTSQRAAATAQRAMQQWARPSETVRSLIAESPSANESLAGSSADSDGSDRGSSRWTRRLSERQGRQNRRRRGSSDTNMNSRQSSQRSQRSWRPSASSDKKGSLKSLAAALAPSEAKARGGGLDCLVQTLDRAERTRRRQRRHALAETSAASSPTATPSSQRGSQRHLQRFQQRQLQRPCVERCRFQICEVTCELGSLGAAGTDADEQDELLTEDEGKSKAQLRADGNQSNAVSNGCRSRKRDTKVSAAPSSSSKRRQRGEEVLIESVAESLVALSRDLQLCVSTIRDTVTELQRCSDSD